MKFQYKFQSVLNIKEKLEQQRKIELGNAMTALKQEEELLIDIHQRRMGYEDSFYEKRGLRIKASDLSELNAAIKYYNEAYQWQETQVKRAQREVEQRREALKQALSERKTYEKLKERAYESYIEEEKLIENKLVDEVTVYKYHSKD